MDLADNSPSLALLRRYETSFARRFHQILGEVDRLQAKRKSQQGQNEPAQNPPKNTQIPESTNTPQPTAPAEPILRNELGQPTILSRRNHKTPPPGDKPPLKIPQKEDDAA
jgi:hypothetical protein